MVIVINPWLAWIKAVSGTGKERKFIEKANFKGTVTFGGGILPAQDDFSGGDRGIITITVHSFPTLGVSSLA